MAKQDRPMQAAPKTPRSAYPAAFCLYLLIAILVTYPLIRDLSGQIAGFVHGDGYEMVHHIWWFTHALKTGEPLFTQTLMGYPDGMDGITLWSNPLQFFPAWLIAFLTGAPAAFNIVILVTLALNGTAMFALMNYLLRRNEHSILSGRPYPAAFISGVVFMLYPTMQAHMAAGHGGLLVQWTFALYTLTLLRLGERDVSLRHITLTAGLFVASAWGHTLQIIYATTPLTLMFVFALVWERDWRTLRRVFAALVMGGVALAVFLLPVASATFGTAAYAEERGVVRYSLDLLAPFTPSFFHPLYSALGYTARVLGVNIDEGAAYIGLVAGLLALVGFTRVPAARRWLVLAAVAFILGLGPVLKLFDQPVTFTVDNYASHITLPFAYLANLPVINLARTPGRFAFALALAAAVMAGYGAATIITKNRTWRMSGVTLLLVGLIAFDYQTFFPLPTIPTAMPREIAALRSRVDVRAVFDVPYDHLIVAKSALYLQTAHERPLIAGQVTRRTPVNPAKLAILEATLDPALLREAGADVVFIHRGAALGGGESGSLLYDRARETLGAPFYEDLHAPFMMENWLSAFEVPQTDAAPQFTVVYDDPTSLTPILTPPELIREDLAVYVYVPRTTGVLMTASLAADGRDVIVYLDETGEPIAHWTINGAAEASVFAGLEAGYHTFTLVLDPPCTASPSETLVCRPVQIKGLSIEIG